MSDVTPKADPNWPTISVKGKGCQWPGKSRPKSPIRYSSSGAVTRDFKSYDYRRPSAAKLGADAGGTLDRLARNAV